MINDFAATVLQEFKKKSFDIKHEIMQFSIRQLNMKTKYFYANLDL